MTRSLLQETDVTITTLTGSWSNVSTGTPGGGTYKTLASAGSASFAVPSGKSGLILTGTISNTSQSFTVTDNGVSVADPVTGLTTWVRGWATAGTAYRAVIMAHPLTSGAHTIVMTWVAGTLTLDESEVYTPDAATVGLIVSTGDSRVYGFNCCSLDAANSLVAPNATFAIQSYVAQLAALLSMTDYSDHAGTLLTTGTASYTGGLTSPQIIGGVSGEALSVAAGAAGAIGPGWKRNNHSNSDPCAWHDQKAQLWLIQYGVNDFRTANDGTPLVNTGFYLQHYLQRMRELVWRATFSVPGSRVLIIGNTPCTYYTQPNYTAGSDAYLAQYNAALAAMCLEPGMTATIWCDVYGDLMGGVQMLSDGLHPGNYGHRVMAKSIARTYRAALGGAGRMGGRH